MKELTSYSPVHRILFLFPCLSNNENGTVDEYLVRRRDSDGNESLHSLKARTFICPELRQLSYLTALCEIPLSH